MLFFFLAGLSFPGFSKENPPQKNLYQEIIYVAVSKTERKAELRTLPPASEPSRVLHTFPIAIGKKLGDKEKSGDFKTPEGIYFTGPHLDTSRLSQIEYGTRAIPLDFPNLMDRRFNVTGYGIWLHGAGDNKRMESDQEGLVTRGCVVYSNEDLLSLLPWLPPHQGIVSISERLDQINPTTDQKELESLTQNWFTAWAKKDHATYMSHYSPDFSMEGKDKKSFAAYKKSLFARYHKMSLVMDTLRVLIHPKYAVAMMNQYFSGNKTFTADGRKIVYWQKNAEGKWLITGETFGTKRFEPMQYSLGQPMASQEGKKETRE